MRAVTVVAAIVAALFLYGAAWQLTRRFYSHCWPTESVMARDGQVFLSFWWPISLPFAAGAAMAGGCTGEG